jgi:DNA-binding transcriptional ArsR family regulator
MLETMRELPEPTVEEIDLASVMHALADPSRLRSVAALAEATDLTSCTDLAELAGAEGLAKSTWSHHLRVLREAGVIRTRHDGTRKFVTLRRADLDHRFPGLLDAVLEGARAEFADD